MKKKASGIRKDAEAMGLMGEGDGCDQEDSVWREIFFPFRTAILAAASIMDFRDVSHAKGNRRKMVMATTTEINMGSIQPRK